MGEASQPNNHGVTGIWEMSYETRNERLRAHVFQAEPPIASFLPSKTPAQTKKWELAIKMASQQ